MWWAHGVWIREGKTAAAGWGGRVGPRGPAEAEAWGESKPGAMRWRPRQTLGHQNPDTKQTGREGDFRAHPGFELTGWGKDGAKEEQSGETFQRNWADMLLWRQDSQVSTAGPPNLGVKEKYLSLVQFNRPIPFYLGLPALFSSLAFRFANRHLTLSSQNYWTPIHARYCPRLWLITGMISCLMFCLWENLYIYIYIYIFSKKGQSIQ